MTLTADLFFSFRSPYSYLATPRLHEMTRTWDLEIALRPVYPIAVRDPGFFSRNPPGWVPYLGRDTRRVAEYLGLPYGFPRPDPIVQDRETRAIAADQPYIRRITRMGVAAARRGPRAGMDFILHVTAGMWGERVQDWHLDANLAPMVARAGLDFAALKAEVEADPDGLDAEVQANQDALEACGHWGVPTLAFEGEPFFGQDRVELALWTMKKAGLQPRA